MERTIGSKGVALLQCVNPRKDKWRVRWDVQEIEDGQNATYLETEYDHKPSPAEIKTLLTQWHNRQCDEKIISGYEWRGMAVWLSAENQFNYKAAYDLAMQTEGKSLPVKFKFGTDESPEYHTFNDMSELIDFYVGAISHVNRTLEECWAAKEAIDLAQYKV